MHSQRRVNVYKNRPALRMTRQALQLAAFLLVVGGAGAESRAQVRWRVIGASGGINGNVLANELPRTGPTGVADACAIPAGTAFAPGVTGTGGVVHQYGLKCFREVEDVAPPPPNRAWVQSVIKARAFIDGDNTNEVVIEWLNLGYCDQDTDGHIADANNRLNFNINLKIVNGPVGADVLVYYYWDAFGGASTSHECPDPFFPCFVQEDGVSISNILSVGRNGGVGRELLGGRFNFASPGGLPGWNEKKGQGGAVAARVGDTINISLDSNGMAHLQSPEPVGIQVGPECDTIFQGKLRITVGYVPLPPPPAPPSPRAEFSLDIGSDHEMSDPSPTGNERFDPGDVYAWGGAPLPVCGADGVRDDATIFAGFDFPPSAPDCATPPATAAPVCFGTWSSSSWFDLDGTDALDFSLIPLLGPARGPINYFPSACIYSTENLAISFDDDGPSHYGGAPGVCSVPVNSTSQNWGATLGTSARDDEVFYVRTVDDIATPTAALVFIAPIADEITVHGGLGLNPDASEARDDDVDALDMMEDPTICTVWYFSADHEATGVHPTYGFSLDPGNIYEVSGIASPATVVDHAFHLGLPDGVDVRDFEFVWLYNEPVNQVWLALIFAVAPDDPLTPDDESGGLDPTTIYASFLDGASFQFLDSPLGENIDAIATWKASLVAPTNGACCTPNGCMLTNTLAQCAAAGGAFRGFGTDCADVNQNGEADVCECTGCRGDLNGDLKINGLDMQQFINCVAGGFTANNCGCADMDGDGDRDLDDVALFTVVLLSGPLQPCP